MDLRQAAQLRSQNRAQAGIGTARQAGFKARFEREQVMRNGKTLERLRGVASTVEQPYQMYDMFGPYNEVISRTAFDHTLAQNPDVAYLLNHTGMTMARTKNGTLSLSADPDQGLMTEALLNPERSDVRDMLAAVDDGDVDEMSFGFIIDDGAWSDDMTEYRIHRVDLHRGDVSAVNFGANPNTTAARSQMILRQLDYLPAGAQTEARDRLNAALRAEDSTDGDAVDTGDTTEADDNNPALLIQAIDAALDEALGLVEGVDTATLPANVAQALGLLSAADTAVDALMLAQGIDDPDERVQSLEHATRDLHSHMEERSENDAEATAETSTEDAEGNETETRSEDPAEVRGAEPVHHTGTVDKPWDAGAQLKKAGNNAKELAHMHAWVDSSADPTLKGSYKLPHHAAGTDTPANIPAVRDALARLSNTDIPESDKPKVKAHLQAHLDDFHKDDKKENAEADKPGRSLRLLELELEAG